MSSTVSVSSGVRWSAASWLFDWVLGTVADELEDPQLAGSLREIVEENLGWLGIDQLPDHQRAELDRVIREVLLIRAEETLPQGLAERDAVIGHLRQLVDLVEAVRWAR